MREDNDFADVTLACEDGQQVEVHKVILAASSPFFQKLLGRNKHPHPLIYMRGMKSDDLLAIVDFLYGGEANVFQENLDSFLAIAEELQLKGLMGKSEDLEKGKKEILPTIDPANPTRITTKDRNCKVERTTELSQRVERSTAERAVAVKGDFNGDFSQLDAQIKSMMEMSQNLVSGGTHRAHICKVCGKEGQMAMIMHHIEIKHMTGVAIPCNICVTTLPSRNALANHRFRIHKNNSQQLVHQPNQRSV